jgi:hypothetical protein
VSAAEFLTDLWATMGMPDAMARIDRLAQQLAPAPASVPPPTVDELFSRAMDRKQSDFIGDLPDTSQATALQIALHCGDSAVAICEHWSDEHRAPPVPLCVQVQLRERLIAAAWELVMASWEQVEDDER